jgi:hypothetical protein
MQSAYGALNLRLLIKKQFNDALGRVDELIKQLQNGSLDSDATADMIEALEELKSVVRARLEG